MMGDDRRPVIAKIRLHPDLPMGLERRISTFFDCMVYHVVRGYEDARRHAALLAA